MNESYAHFPSGAQVRIQPDSIGVLTGIARHRLVLNVSLSTANEQADGITLTISGDVTVAGLGGLSGYLGTIILTTPMVLRRDGSFGTASTSKSQTTKCDE
jgi:hypothetical protein